ncbi:hypothetical protein V9K67_21205 [Paraflavisolibacter sp. H34]|uniref:hypothetical protein n=1 Tax=Huijunlia imazamoxiresistens TaxID=3127457 RepID=UPI003019A68D
MKRFFITVNYKFRTYEYKVEQRPDYGEGEIISIITPKKTVVLTARCPGPQKGRGSRKKVYSYDEDAVSNKVLMARVIRALEQYGTEEGCRAEA